MTERTPDWLIQRRGDQEERNGEDFLPPLPPNAETNTGTDDRSPNTSEQDETTYERTPDWLIPRRGDQEERNGEDFLPPLPPNAETNTGTDDRSPNTSEQDETTYHALDRYFVLGLGGTGVQIVDQAQRANHVAEANGKKPPVQGRNYNYLLLDTSEDSDPENPVLSHTHEGVMQRWLDRDNIETLARLAGGASRLPPIAEFVADETLDLYMGTPRRQFSLKNAQTTFLVHSGGGGTGSGLAPVVASWLRSRSLGGKLVSIVTLNKASGDTKEDLETENALYNFPRVNRSVELLIALDNSVMAQNISTNGKTGRDVRRYLNEIRDRDLNGCPDYLSTVTDQGYLVGDRYAYRILNTLTSMPGDLGNNLSFFASDPYYNLGAKWVVPYIYPLDRNYETDYQGIPPAQFALRALSMGGLCLVQEEDMKGCMALVIFEIPKDYPFRSIEEDVKRVVSGVLGTHPRQTRVLVSTCPVDAISVTIFLLRPKTNFLDQWCTESTDGDRKKALQSHWYSRTQTDGRELTGPWAGIINAMVATSYDARSPNESMEDIRQQLEKKAFRKAAESSEINICDDFAAYAKQVGLI